MVCSICQTVELTVRNRSGFCPPCYKKNYRSSAKAKEYQSKYYKDWSKNNEDKVKDHQLRRYYDINLEEYREIEKSQNYKCKICLQTNKHTRMFAVDHCHKTGKVRGLLCTNCNTAIGLFEENKDNLLRAIEYLNL